VLKNIWPPAKAGQPDIRDRHQELGRSLTTSQAMFPTSISTKLLSPSMASHVIAGQVAAADRALNCLQNSMRSLRRLDHLRLGGIINQIADISAVGVSAEPGLGVHDRLFGSSLYGLGNTIAN